MLGNKGAPLNVVSEKKSEYNCIYHVWGLETMKVTEEMDSRFFFFTCLGGAMKSRPDCLLNNKFCDEKKTNYVVQWF